MIEELCERGGEISKLYHILVRTRVDLKVLVWCDDAMRLSQGLILLEFIKVRAGNMQPAP